LKNKRYLLRKQTPRGTVVKQSIVTTIVHLEGGSNYTKDMFPVEMWISLFQTKKMRMWGEKNPTVKKQFSVKHSSPFYYHIPWGKI
jgi:hypothetical protein